MPSFNSKVQICNYALKAIGHSSTITSIDENTTAAANCNLFFDRDRVSLFHDHDWAFARKIVKLVEVTAPVPWWDYAYQQPGDALQIVRLADQSFKRQSDTRRIDYEKNIITQSGADLNIIRTDLAGAYMVYTKDIKDPARWPQPFVDAMTYRLASSIALPMTGDKQIAAEMSGMATGMLHRAQALDNSEGTDRYDWFDSQFQEARQ